jgi:hypothetical protein
MNRNDFLIEKSDNHNRNNAYETQVLHHHSYYFHNLDNVLLMELSVELLGMKVVVDKLVAVVEPVVLQVEVVERVCPLIY